MNRLPLEKQTAVIAALCEGMSIRAVERLTGVHRDTIMRLGTRAGQGCERIHDYLIRDLNVAVIQLDELWAYIGKKQRRLLESDSKEKGDCYTFIAIDSVNKAIISYRSGKRDGANTEFFLKDLKSRILNVPSMSSDAFRFYESAVRRIFGRRVKYGQVIKSYNGEPDPDAARRYSPGVVVAIKRKPIIGNPKPEEISTSHVERQNLSVRMASRRFTRLTNAYSKKVENHAAAVSLYVAHYNFCRVHEKLRVTPAMAIGVTDHVWSIMELIEAATTGEVSAITTRRRLKMSKAESA